ncbi:hypothetical protein BV898_04371 [Hypsibius exemplaris]|uniref:Uncharacterized protein n=1 Tax=Hypsibius exemplaris TaxID=2072580 RepID=A0A1W0X2R3_HYPEX|nr:hypothetical protein BV898_04371 [Hypsibius exemplaris]
MPFFAQVCHEPLNDAFYWMCSVACFIHGCRTTKGMARSCRNYGRKLRLCDATVELAVQVAERAHADEVMIGGFSPVTVAAAAVWWVLWILKQQKVLLRKVVATTRRMEERFDRL